MTNFVPLGEGPVPPGKEIRSGDFAVSFVGEDRARKGLWFGAEDGRICLVDPGNLNARVTSYGVAESKEPVNGVASLDGYVAVSTRNEIVITHGPAPNEQSLPRLEFNGGAHGVIATPTGRFVAPLGPQGLLVVKPGSSDPLLYDIIKQDRSFYKVASLGTEQGQDVLSCALRGSGIAIMRLGDPVPAKPKIAVASPGFDVVDTCALAAKTPLFAAAALTLEGFIIFIGVNGLEIEMSVLQVAGLKGTPYRILSARGNIFVLTSSRLYCLTEFASRLLKQDFTGPKEILELHMEAVDASIAFDKLLMVVMASSVLITNIPKWLKQHSGNKAEETKGLWHRTKKQMPTSVKRKRELVPA